MKKFNEALINAEVEKQDKEKVRKAKKQYLKDLLAQGIDKETAKVMVQIDFEYGLVNAL